MIHMKCQDLFSEKNKIKKIYLKVSSAAVVIDASRVKVYQLTGLIFILRDIPVCQLYIGFTQCLHLAHKHTHIAVLT